MFDALKHACEVVNRTIAFGGFPGCGKGGQAGNFKEILGFPNTSTGDECRFHTSQKTPLGLEIDRYSGAGLLVPDHILLEQIFYPKLLTMKEGTPRIDDGIPRNAKQYSWWKNTNLKRGDPRMLVIHIVTTRETAVHRMRLRKRPGETDEIIQRRADEYEAVLDDMWNAVTKDHSNGLIDYIEVSGEPSKDVVSKNIYGHLKQLGVIKVREAIGV